VPHLVLDRVATSSAPALKTVSLGIRDGECVAVLGDSGSGKTSLLATVAGFIPVGSGEIRVDGQMIDGLKPADRRIGMVFREYALYPNMNVQRNLSFGMKVRRTPAHVISSRLNRLLSCLPLQSVLESQPDDLSRLEQALVALGRSVIDHPDLVLLDEPLASLPPRDHGMFTDCFLAVRQEYHPTVLYAASTPEEASSIADLVAVMHDGSIAQTGSPDALYSRPINIHVAGLTSSIPPARINGSISIREHGPVVLVQSRSIPVPPVIESRLMDGQPVILLVRPEHIGIGSIEERGCLPGEVSAVKRILPDMLVTVVLEDRAMIPVRTTASACQDLVPGMQVGISFDLANIILFDRITGDALY